MAGGDRRRRSRSRSRSNNKKRPKKPPRGASSSGSPARSKSPTKRRGRETLARATPSDQRVAATPASRQVAATPPARHALRAQPAAAAAAASEEEEQEDEEDGSEGEYEWEDGNASNGAVLLEARVALLEVEVAALKAENLKLKTKLVEFMQRGLLAPPRKRSLEGNSSTGRARAVASKPGQQPQPPQQQPDAPAAGGGGSGSGSAAGAASSSSTTTGQDRRARLAAAAAERPSGRVASQQRQREEAVRHYSGSPPEESGGGGGGGNAPDEDVGTSNAVMLCNSAMEAYNEAVPNNIPPESRLPLVNAKMERFMGNFGDKVQILDLKSGGAVIKDQKLFVMRYGCVFRESGSRLKGTCHKRFYYDASGGRPTYSLDFETHESLVTAMPGTPQDGKLGVREARTEHLAVLYEERGGKITRMWLRPDSEKLGLDPTAGEDIIVRTEAFKAFEAKIESLEGSPPRHTIFHNYHETPTVG